MICFTRRFAAVLATTATCVTFAVGVTAGLLVVQHTEHRATPRPVVVRTQDQVTSYNDGWLTAKADDRQLGATCGH